MHFKLFLISAATMVNAAYGDTHESINLGKAGNYAILAKAGITDAGASIITGDIAVSPIAGTSMTGFGLPLTSPKGFKRPSSDIAPFTRKFYAPEYAPLTAVKLTGAVSDMLIAYNYAAGVAVTGGPFPGDFTGKKKTDTYSNLNNGELGGLTLTAGVYDFGVEVTIDDTLTFDGSATDIFIIKTSKSVTQTAGNVELTGGAKAENIFWQVAETVKVGGGATMVGTLLVWTSVEFMKLSSLNGRILAGTAVTLDQTTITDPTYPSARRGLRGLQVV